MSALGADRRPQSIEAGTSNAAIAPALGDIAPRRIARWQWIVIPIVRWIAPADTILERCMRPRKQLWPRARKRRIQWRWFNWVRFNWGRRLRRRFRLGGSPQTEPEPNSNRNNEEYQDEKYHSRECLHPRQVILRLFEVLTRHFPAPDGVTMFIRRCLHVLFGGLWLPIAVRQLFAATRHGQHETDLKIASTRVTRTADRGGNDAIRS